MLFEVFFGGERKFSTAHNECMPSGAQLKQMLKLGYKFKKDGKAWKVPSDKSRQSKGE